MKNLPLCGIFQVSVQDETMHKLNLTDQTSLSLAAHGEEVQKLTLISHCQIGFATSMFFCSLLQSFKLIILIALPISKRSALTLPITENNHKHEYYSRGAFQMAEEVMAYLISPNKLVST